MKTKKKENYIKDKKKDKVKEIKKDYRSSFESSNDDDDKKSSMLPDNIANLSVPMNEDQFVSPIINKKESEL